MLVSRNPACFLHPVDRLARRKRRTSQHACPPLSTGVAKKILSRSTRRRTNGSTGGALCSCSVATSRSGAHCLIMGLSLDMEGLLGAATVMGTLMYGAGHVWAGRAHFYLHEHELSLFSRRVLP